MSGLTMKVVDQFFDRAAVEKAIDPAAKKAMSRHGAFIRRGARSSIRYSKKTSEPGQPPRAHTRDKRVTIKNILFAYDASSRTLVVGPVALNGNNGQVPEALEKGGKVTVKSGPRRKRRKRTVTIRPRPFMVPAYKKEESKIPQLWRDSVK